MAPIQPDEKAQIVTHQVPRSVTITSIVLSVVYFIAICIAFKIGNPFLFSLLVAGEIFHLWQSLGYAYTIWRLEQPVLPEEPFKGMVDVCITVAGEPVEIIETTIQAALAMDYPHFKLWILNDSRVAKKINWHEYELLAAKYNIGCITRTVPGGAKAGNINNATRQLTAPFIAIFDADHVPHPDFLAKTMGYFHDPKMGFVQSPQYYNNQHLNAVTGAAWEQQEIFFGPILQGKQRLGSAFMCGTNMILRRTALAEAGGMNEHSIAEDFLTSVYIHARGYKSTYVPEVLAEGLAPEDFMSYYKQQHRWARGSLELIFRHNPVFMKGLTIHQKLQYLISASYYLNGTVVLMNALLPVIFFYTGAVVFQISTMTLAAVFLPYIFLSIYLLQVSSNFSYTFRALSFSMSSFWLQIDGMVSVITGRKASFAVTSKTALKGNFVRLVIPHLTYIVVALIGIGYAISKQGFSASVMTNIAWATFNIAIFVPFITAALPSGATPAAEVTS